ncbi:MAG: hypothetical protein IJV69_04610, partial [Kiritimatiellae bacterium]|nr:hypothetical protein [Kiritimatiellia bacterium]
FAPRATHSPAGCPFALPSLAYRDDSTGVPSWQITQPFVKKVINNFKTKTRHFCAKISAKTPLNFSDIQPQFQRNYHLSFSDIGLINRPNRVDYSVTLPKGSRCSQVHFSQFSA